MTESKNVRTAMNVRFGAFEVDLEGRRLLKRGMPVTLREQSFQVLAALMERKKLNDRLPLGEGYFGYLAGVLGHSVEARSLVGDLEAVAKRITAPPCPLRGPISAWVKQPSPRLVGDRSGRTRPVLGIGNGIPRLRRYTRASKIQATGTPTQTFHLAEISVYEQFARIF
jgi:hypothetical protein